MSLLKQRCRVCGCTDEDCSQCIAKTGEACSWVESDLCSTCSLLGEAFLYFDLADKTGEVREGEEMQARLNKLFEEQTYFPPKDKEFKVIQKHCKEWIGTKTYEPFMTNIPFTSFLLQEYQIQKEA